MMSAGLSTKHMHATFVRDPALDPRLPLNRVPKASEGLLHWD